MSSTKLSDLDSDRGGERAVKRMFSGNAARASLADISNFPRQSKPLEQVVKPKSAKECVEELVKENMALKNLLLDRNKIIESRGLELHKLQINLQKVRLQNSQLALTNSQLSADLNVSKDRLKSLHHEFACMNGMLKARNAEMADLKKRNSENTGGEDGIIKCAEGGEISQGKTDDDKPCSLGPSPPTLVQANDMANRKRRQSAMLESMKSESSRELSVTDDGKQFEVNMKQNNKRHSSRRQSSRFKSKQLGGNEDEELFETNDKRLFLKEKAYTKRVLECSEELSEIDADKFHAFPVCNDQILGLDSLPLSSSRGDGKNESQEFRRSIGRPLRQAAVRVQSYKEIPLKVKMRRPESQLCGLSSTVSMLRVAGATCPYPEGGDPIFFRGTVAVLTTVAELTDQHRHDIVETQTSSYRPL